MIYRINIIVLFACFCIGFLNVPSFGDSGNAGSIEELLFMEIPSIVAASRREQSVTEAPASVEVISADEIKQCGATSIPEVLRMVAGVGLITTNSRNSLISIRGFHEAALPGVGDILAMIDGRPIEWDIYNIELWGQQTISLDEIERIEIIKGPGSSLYGANAYSGVINIITKTPEQLDGTEVNVIGGAPRLFDTSVIHGYSGKKVDYKVSAGFNSQDEYVNSPNKDAGQVSKGNALIKYKISEDSALSLSGGRAYTLNDKFSDGPVFGIGTNVIGVTNDYAQLDYTAGNLHIRSYFKESIMNVQFPANNTPWNFRTMSNDTELQDSFNIHDKHSLVWGISYRNILLKQDEITSSDNTQDSYAIFAEDQYTATDKLKIILGARYDKSTLTDSRISPRVGLLYTIKDGHVIMISGTQAFRNPTLLDSYFNSTSPLPLPLPANAVVLGNKNLNPETVTSYEAEYRYKLSGRINGKIGGFYNIYSDFILMENSAVYYPANTVPGLAANTLPMVVTSNFVNGGKAENVGGEFSINALLSNWLSGMLNYTYVQTKDEKDNPGTILINEKDYVRQDAPKNIVNAALNAKFKNGISSYLGAQWVDSMVYDYENSITATNVLINLNAYTIINARIGYLFKDNRTEISLAAFNLFDQNVYEGLPGTNAVPAGQLITGEALGRRVTAKVSCKF